MLKNITIKSIKKDEINEAIEAFYNDNEIKIHINDYLEIVFICLDNDLECLVYGYLSDISKNCIKDIKIEKNNIFVQISLQKDEFLNLLNDREIIQTCESINLTDNRILKDRLVIPFNGSKKSIQINYLLESCNDFYFKDSNLCRARILFLGNNKNNENIINPLESYDTNPKNALYKTIGMAKIKRDDLLDSIIFINFRLDMEILKKIILSKITFIIFIEKPSFTILKLAQKFGLTLGEYINKEEIKILTHSARIVNT